MTIPWLSVVIPTHDGERWLGQALQSLVDQGDREFECIVVDSSAAPRTLQIAEEFAGRLSIRMHHRPDLLPWTAKTNFAVSIARAAHLCMLHQDDLWQPERATQLRRWLQTHPDGVMYLHPSWIVDERGKRLGRWRCPLPVREQPVPASLLMQRLLIQNFIAIPAPMIRREAYLRVDGMDVPLWYTADWDLYLKLCMAGPVYYCDQAMTCFRVHADSLTMTGSRSAAAFRAQLQTVLDRHSDQLPLPIRAAVVKVARAALELNVAMASAPHGHLRALLAACGRIVGLGPAGMWRFFRDSRLTERVIPRLRARLAGGL